MANEKWLKVIDYDAVRDAFDEEYKKTRKLIESGETHLDNLAEGFTEADMVLRKMLNVDAVEVVHGRWLTWEEQFPGEKPRRANNLGVFCDKCHNHADNRTDFCPNCGANMKGE